MKIVIFDFDGTLFKKQAIPYLMKYYRENGFSKVAYYKKYTRMIFKLFKYKIPVFKNYGKEQFRKEAAVLFMQCFNGKKQEELHTFFAEASPYMMQFLDQDVVAEVKRCKDEGYKCILLSGCYTPLLKYIGDEVGIDRVIGTDIEIAQGKEKVAIQSLDVPMGKRKVEKLMEAISDIEVDWANSRAYADSIYDQDVLKLVGNPVAVKPDEGLKDLAEKEGWRIML